MPPSVEAAFFRIVLHPMTDDIDYSAAETVCDLLGELASKSVRVAFARVSGFLRADLHRLGISAMLGEARIFETLHMRSPHQVRIVPSMIQRARTSSPQSSYSVGGAWETSSRERQQQTVIRRHQ